MLAIRSALRPCLVPSLSNLYIPFSNPKRSFLEFPEANQDEKPILSEEMTKRNNKIRIKRKTRNLDIRRYTVADKILLLSGLPFSVTPEDIRSLAPKAKTFRDLGRIEYLYDRNFKPNGKAFLRFSCDSHAEEFERACTQRALAGKMLRTHRMNDRAYAANLIDYYGNWPLHYRIPFDLIEYESGKLVVLRNIPQDTTEARLEERLSQRYDLRQQERWRGKCTSRAGFNIDVKGYGGSHDQLLGGVLKLEKAHPDATTTSFIVRCKTPYEAHRLVRRWHNTYFAPKTFPIHQTAGRFRVEAAVLY